MITQWHLMIILMVMKMKLLTGLGSLSQRFVGLLPIG